MANSYGVKPYGEKKTAVVKGRRMAYIEEGSGFRSFFSTEIRHPPICGAISCPILRGLGASSRVT